MSITQFLCISIYVCVFVPFLFSSFFMFLFTLADSRKKILSDSRCIFFFKVNSSLAFAYVRPITLQTLVTNELKNWLASHTHSLLFFNFFWKSKKLKNIYKKLKKKLIWLIKPQCGDQEPQHLLLVLLVGSLHTCLKVYILKKKSEKMDIKCCVLNIWCWIYLF